MNRIAKFFHHDRSDDKMSSMSEKVRMVNGLPQMVGPRSQPQKMATAPAMAPMMEPAMDSMMEPKMDSMMEPKKGSKMAPKKKSMMKPAMDSMMEPKMDSMMEPKMDTMMKPKMESKMAMAPTMMTSSGPLTVVEIFQSQGCSSCPPANSNVISLSSSDPNVLLLTYEGQNAIDT